MVDLFDKFIKFSNEQVKSKDIDPIYPLIKEVNNVENIGLEDSIWRLLLYVTWYRLASSELVFLKYPTENIINDTFILKTGVERRGFRGNNKGVEMINNFLIKNKSISDYVKKISDKTGEEGWRFIRSDFEEIKWNGNWASYKWADLMKNVIGLNILSPNIGGEKVNKHSPVTCLNILLKEVDEEMTYEYAKDENLQKLFYNECKENGAIFNGLDQMETCLCDYKNVMNGKYWSGKDIKEIFETLDELPSIWGKVFKKLFEEKYYK